MYVDETFAQYGVIISISVMKLVQDHRYWFPTNKQDMNFLLHFMNVLHIQRELMLIT